MTTQTTQVTGDVRALGTATEWVFDIRQVGTKIWLTPRQSASARGASYPNRPTDPPFVEIEFDFEALMKAIDPHLQRLFDKSIEEDGVGF